MSDDNTSPPKTEPHMRQNENRDTTDRETAKAAIEPEPCGNRASPACDPPKLPRITLPQRGVIRDLMKPYAGLRFTLLREDPTEDSDQYADQIEAALLDAGLIDSSDRNITVEWKSQSSGSLTDRRQQRVRRSRQSVLRDAKSGPHPTPHSPYRKPPHQNFSDHHRAQPLDTKPVSRPLVRPIFRRVFRFS